MAVKVVKKPWTVKRFFTDALDTYKGLPGEAVLDFRESTPRMLICDGVTPGGNPVGGGGTNGIAIPQIVSPINGATGVDASPIITASAFNGITEGSLADVHAASTWTFYSDAGLTTQLHTSGRDTTNLTSYDLSAAGVTFDGDAQVYAQVEYEGDSGTTATSAAIVFTVLAIGPGAVVDGDIVVGQFEGNWILVAPATQRVLRKWGLRGTDTSLPNNPTHDPNSSEHNTDVLTSAAYNTINDGYDSTGCPAAEYCRSLGAHDLPNNDLLNYIYENQAAIDAADDSGGNNTLANIGAGSATGSSTKYAWTSTEHSSYLARIQRLSDGRQHGYGKNGEYWVVPVRSIPV